MSQTEIREAVLRVLGEIAPEAAGAAMACRARMLAQ